MPKKPRSSGKYSHILPYLPKRTPEDAKHQEVLGHIRNEVLTSEGEPDAYRRVSQLMAHIVPMLVELRQHLGSLPSRQLTAAAMTRAYAEVRQVEEVLDAHVKKMTHLLEVYEGILADAYEGEGIKSLKLEDGGSVRVEPGIYAQVIDRERYRQWCIKQGLEKDMHLHPSTTLSMLKELLLNKQGEPPGVQATFDNKIVYTK